MQLLAISLVPYSNGTIKKQKTNLTKLGNRNDSSEENECDDKNAGNIFKMQFWKMPLYDKLWRDDIQMQLTKEEGEFLREQIIFSCPDSMLAYILKNNITEVLYLEKFSQLETIIHIFPEDIQEKYNLALSFSKFIYVAQTLYNIMVSDGQNKEANEAFEELKEVMAELANIDVDLIFARLYIYKTDLKNFIKKLQECMFNNDVEEMKKVIKAREIMLKGQSRAKTAHPGEIMPIQWIGGKGLDYRFFNAKRILRDIFESEGLIDAESK